MKTRCATNEGPVSKSRVDFEAEEDKESREGEVRGSAKGRSSVCGTIVPRLISSSSKKRMEMTKPC